MKETLASEMRRQEGNTLQVNTIIDFIQIKAHRAAASESLVGFSLFKSMYFHFVCSLKQAFTLLSVS